MGDFLKIERSAEGDKAVNLLRQLEDDLKRGKVVGSGLTEAAKPIKKSMINGIRQRSGLLKLAIGQRRLRATEASRLSLFGDEVVLKPGQVALLIGPVRKVGGLNQNRIANFLEFGTEAHEIKPRTAKVLRLFGKSFGGGGLKERVDHPGAAGTHFMQKALDMNGAGIQDGFAKGALRTLRKYGFS